MSSTAKPAPLATTPRNELTLRGLVLGVVITVVFTAANVYFGLKAGLTFATSIPAAVISMALLRGLKGMTVQENNIVQTVASAAGTLSSVIFVLPGMVIIGWWTGFPYWVSCAICALGGILGVMYSIPLRRALVTQSDLPYPEGVACAEVLKVGGGENADAAAVEESRTGLAAVVWGAVVSAAFACIVATRIFASDVVRYFRVGGERGGVTGFDFLLSFALFAVGHLVGLWVGIAMFVGALIGWAWGVPHFSALAASTEPMAQLAQHTWSHQVRFVGAGTIGVAAVWTLAKLVKPVIAGLRTAMAASRARAAGNAALLPRTEQDIPIGWVALVSLACMVPIGALIANFSAGSGLGRPYVRDGDQRAGLHRAHELLRISGLRLHGRAHRLIEQSSVRHRHPGGDRRRTPAGAPIRSGLPASAGTALVAYALFVTAVVFTVAAIANNNLQDLKTGQLVDATPWKQQVALVIGVIAGAAIIPPILDLLNHAYGFAGAPGPHHEHPLPAPQAGLISALAQGVIQHNVDWSLIRIGALVGVLVIAADESLRRFTTKAHLSPLAVGLGIYLPTQSTLMVVVGAIAGWYFDRRAQRASNPQATKQLGVLLASGMIVGEGLVGVIISAFVAFSGKDFPLALVGDEFADNAAVWIGSGVFALTVFLLYRWAARMRPARQIRAAATLRK